MFDSNHLMKAFPVSLYEGAPFHCWPVLAHSLALVLSLPLTADVPSPLAFDTVYIVMTLQADTADTQQINTLISRNVDHQFPLLVKTKPIKTKTHIWCNYNKGTLH